MVAVGGINKHGKGRRVIRDVCPSCVFSRAFYVVVVPLKKQRTGKFLKPWDNPDEMNLEEVRSKKI